MDAKTEPRGEGGAKMVGWRLSPDLIRLVRLDAAERNVSMARVVEERLIESFVRDPLRLSFTREDYQTVR